MASTKLKPERQSSAWLYRLTAIAILPLCVAAARTLWLMIGGGDLPFQNMAGTAPGWFFCAGMVFWLFVSGLTPRPVRLYVLGHELTHGLGAWLSGGEARRLRVGKRGGSIFVTRSNVFVVLAPYFIPFYAALLLAFYFVSAVFIDPHPWHHWWMAALGVAWGFHLTFTISMMAGPQSDLAVYGFFCSCVLILLFNMLALAIGMVWVADPTFNEFATTISDETLAVYKLILRWIGTAINRAAHPL